MVANKLQMFCLLKHLLRFNPQTTNACMRNSCSYISRPLKKTFEGAYRSALREHMRGAYRLLGRRAIVRVNMQVEAVQSWIPRDGIHRDMKPPPYYLLKYMIKSYSMTSLCRVLLQVSGPQPSTTHGPAALARLFLETQPTGRAGFEK